VFLVREFLLQVEIVEQDCFVECTMGPNVSVDYDEGNGGADIARCKAGLQKLILVWKFDFLQGSNLHIFCGALYNNLVYTIIIATQYVKASKALLREQFVPCTLAAMVLNGVKTKAEVAKILEERVSALLCYLLATLNLLLHVGFNSFHSAPPDDMCAECILFYLLKFVHFPIIIMTS